MGIMIFGLLVLALFLFMMDGHGFFTSIALIAIGLVAPFILIPVVAIMIFYKTKGY